MDEALFWIVVFYIVSMGLVDCDNDIVVLIVIKSSLSGWITKLDVISSLVKNQLHDVSKKSLAH